MTPKELNGLFGATAPTPVQRERMLRAILQRKEECSPMETKTNTRRRFGALPRLAMAAVALCLVSVLCFQLFGSSPLALQVYAFESGEQLEGGQVSGGELNDDGSGSNPVFYLLGKDIQSIHVTTEHQYLTFIDWSGAREQIWRQKDFTVEYGPDDSVYDKLVFYWDCFDASELLRDPAMGVSDLPEDLRRDTITLTATFGNGKTLTRVLEIAILDSGEITLDLKK